MANFRRKFWTWLLTTAQAHLSPDEVTNALEPYWWDLVKLRIAEMSSSDVGSGIVHMLFVKDEDAAIDNSHREMRDRTRDVRVDREKY